MILPIPHLSTICSPSTFRIPSAPPRSQNIDHTIGDILFRLIRWVGAPVGFLLVHFASVFSFQGAYQRSYSLRFFALRRNMRCNSRVSRSFAKISVNTSLTRCGASLIA